MVPITGRPFMPYPALADTANAILEAWLPGEEGRQGGGRGSVRRREPSWDFADHLPQAVGQVPDLLQRQAGRDPVALV